MDYEEITLFANNSSESRDETEIAPEAEKTVDAFTEEIELTDDDVMNELDSAESLEDEIQNQTNGNKVTTKAIIVSGIALGVTVLACIFVLIAVYAPSKYITMKHSIFDDYTTESIYADDVKVMSEVSSNKTSLSSLDGSFYAVLDQNKLFVINAERHTSSKISDSVKKCAISASGNAIVYIEGDDNLYIYYTGSKKTKQISTGVSTSGLAVSYRASCVAFTKQLEDTKCFVWKGRKEKELADGFVPVSASDDGKNIICKQITSGALYAYDYSGKNNVLSEKSGTYFTVNYSGTEVIYSENDRLFVSVNGKEGKFITDGYHASVIPEKGYNVCVTKQDYTTVAPVRTFKKTVILSSDNTYSSLSNVCRIDGSYNGEVVLENVLSAQLSKGQKNVVARVLNEDSFNLIEYVFAKKQEKKVFEYSTDFAVAPNGTIYVLGDNKTLYIISNGRKTELAVGVRSIEALNDGYIYYLDLNNDVYKSKYNSKTTDRIAGNIEVLGSNRINPVAYNKESEIVFI